jgi:hypothetical protein
MWWILGGVAWQCNLKWGYLHVHAMCIFHPKCEAVAQAVAKVCNNMNYLLKDGYCVVQCSIVILSTTGKCAVFMPYQFQLSAQASATSMMP